MGDIKSAWEIAMEKAEKIGKLSAEELIEQKEKEYELIGKTIADKYFAGLDLWQLQVELDKYKGEEREGIKKVTLIKLVKSIELGNYKRLEQVFDGIAFLKEDEGMRLIQSEISQIFNEYEQISKKRFEEVEKSGWQVLHQLRIAGSAIESINPKAQEEWAKITDRFANPYIDRLEELKKELLA
jgi:glutamate synthase domain-containing protein 2